MSQPSRSTSRRAASSPRCGTSTRTGPPHTSRTNSQCSALFKFKTTTGATTVLWETCAPGHGKGPWDGIGAVIKRFVRLLEKQNKVYNNGARDVFVALLDSFQSHKVGSRVTIADFVFHYILSPGEPLLDRANVWSPIVRPSARPTVTQIKGIRNSFCFRVAGDNTLAVRELSCRCTCCLEQRWTDCKSTDAGEWKYVAMTSTPASAGAHTRSQRSAVSALRRKLAKDCKVDEIIAMESCDDLEGFPFRLARADGPAFQYQGPRKTENGRTFIPNTWYIKVQYYERFPVDSASLQAIRSSADRKRRGCARTQHPGDTGSTAQFSQKWLQPRAAPSYHFY